MPLQQRLPFQSPLDEEESTALIQAEKYEKCEYCSSKLIYSHSLDLTYFQVIETGRCPGCGVSLNPKRYTLH